MVERGATSGSSRGAAWSSASPQRQNGIPPDATGDPRFWQAAGLNSPQAPPPSRANSRSMTAQPLPSPEKMREAMATLRAVADAMEGQDRTSSSSYRRAYDELEGAMRWGQHSGYMSIEEGAREPTGCAACCAGVKSMVSHVLSAAVGAFKMMMLPLGYYAVGILVYQYLEGWAPLDTAYFLTVTSTTVGYGDFCPTSVWGKLFTTLYALIGITVILGALAPLVAFLRGDWRENLLTLLGCGQKVDTNDPNLTMEEVNRLISYPRRYALALLGPGFVMVAGMLLHFFLIREPPEAAGGRSWSLSADLGAGVLGFDPYAIENTLGFDLEVDVEGLVDSFYWVRARSHDTPRPRIVHAYA
jgi:hypothetical protein